MDQDLKYTIASLCLTPGSRLSAAVLVASHSRVSCMAKKKTKLILIFRVEILNRIS